MLYKSLHFKLVLMLVLFIICIISFISVVMLNLVFNFYTNNFNITMGQVLNEDTLSELSSLMTDDYFYVGQADRLWVEHGNLGINEYRNIYILDMDGNYLAGTNDELGRSLLRTPNMLAAMTGKTGDRQAFGLDYMDYAVYLSGGNNQDGSVRECIIYIKDTREEIKRFSWEIFPNLMQVLLIGLGIAVLLSFFFAKAITSPIQSITKGALKLADGDFRKIELASNDEVGTLILTFNDMAEKLNATLDEVSSEREKLKIIFSYLNDGVLLFSNDGKIVSINPQANRILGDDVGEDNNFNDFLDLFGLNINTEESKEKNGGYIFRDISYKENIFDISISRKSPDGIIVVIHDVTQSYSLEKSRREFIANVSHELNTPLSSIKGAAESMSDDRMGEEIKKRFLHIILSESDRMKRIVEDLLIISRLDNKRMMWQFTEVNLEDLSENIYETKLFEADKNGQTLTFKKGKNIPVIYADKGRIEQVLVNIVSNALKYTPQGGKIEFTVGGCKIRSGGTERLGVKIAVKDNGVGIPKEDLPHIFERFYRVEKARSTEAGGTGLGLSIANEIIHAHRGQITIDSAPGMGTAVTIILPQNLPQPAIGAGTEARDKK